MYNAVGKVVIAVRDGWALPEINAEKCTGCGTCVEQCPTQAVEMTEEGPCIVRPQDCTYCTDCEAICPEGAIQCPYEITWDENCSQNVETLG